MADKFQKTNEQFKEALSSCRSIFENKLKDYGASWRIMRPASLTDQMLIKAMRIRQFETTGEAFVDEGIFPEFQALVNYGIVALIQMKNGYVDTVDMSIESALAAYDEMATETLNLMQRKNHDYDEAWRLMRVSSYTDFILTKLNRNKEIEDHQGHTTVSEGADSNYMDIINYAVFGLIKLGEEA